jgi:hypothetical protein
MVKLTEVEDEHFAEKPATTKDDALLANDDDDDDDYTDTGTSLRELCSVSVPSQLFAHAIYCTGATQPIYYEGRSTLSPLEPRLMLLSSMTLKLSLFYSRRFSLLLFSFLKNPAITDPSVPQTPKSHHPPTSTPPIRNPTRPSPTALSPSRISSRPARAPESSPRPLPSIVLPVVR